MKFRVWDKQAQKMLYDGFILRAGNDIEGAELIEEITEEQNAQVCKITKDETATYSLIDWSNHYSLENLIVMMNTGFKDKNSKDIFEGDVVDIKGTKYEVRFIVGGFILLNLTNIQSQTIVNFISEIITKHIEVITNVWQPIVGDKHE